MVFSLFQEQRTGEIALHFDDDTVETLLKYIYTGENILTRTNVLQVYQAAHMLQIASLISMCEHFLKTDISAENCLGIWKISKLLGRSDMTGVAMVSILQHFNDISSAEAFEEADLDIADLKTILEDHNLNSTPSTICNAAVIWLTLLEGEDKETSEDLFRFLVTACKIPVEVLERSLDEDNHTLWKNFSSAPEAQARRNTYQETIRRISQENSPGSGNLHDRTDEGFIVIGGDFMKSKTFMMVLNLRNHKWYTLQKLPEDPGFHFAVCCSGTCLYLTGGTGKNRNFLQYDITENTWTRLPDIPVAREGHGMAGFDNAIYMFGGKTDPEPCVSYVEMLIPEEGTWRKVGEMAKPVYSPSYCILHNTIYIFGGSMVDSTSPTDWAQCYDTTNNLSWNLDFKLPFRSKSSSLLAVAGTNRIYFVNKGRVYSLKPKERTREELSLSPGPKTGAGATSYGDKILIIGGEDENYRNLDTIILFDPLTKHATPLPSKTPWTLTGFHSAKMKIPSALVHALTEVQSSDGALP